MAQDLVGTRAPSAEEGRQRHHRGSAQTLRLDRELDHDSSRRVVDRHDHRHPSCDLLDAEGEQLAFLRLREQVPLRGIRQHHETVDAAADAKVDETALALEVDCTVGPEAGGEDREDAAQLRRARRVGHRVRSVLRSPA